METSMHNHAQVKPDLIEYIWGWCDAHQTWCVMLVKFREGAEPSEHIETGGAEESPDRRTASKQLHELAEKLSKGRISIADAREVAARLGVKL